MNKNVSIQVQGIVVNIIKQEKNDYVSLTDMIKEKD
jgi:hypothetical protein